MSASPVGVVLELGKIYDVTIKDRSGDISKDIIYYRVTYKGDEGSMPPRGYAKNFDLNLTIYCEKNDLSDVLHIYSIVPSKSLFRCLWDKIKSCFK